MKSIAVLMTCFNRVNTTLKCLEHLYKAEVPDGYYFDVFLVDDKSPDNTGVKVKENHPQINVISGTGSLYWTGGMRLAWEIAAKKKEYDFYLWLNDDTFIFPDALTTILNDYISLKNKNIESLLVSALEDPISHDLSYSGRFNREKVIPSGVPSTCTYVTGNFVLVSKTIYNKIGNLSKRFSHGLGDNDYGYRAIKNGFSCHVTSKIVGQCSIGERILWNDPKLPLKERAKRLFSKTGGNIVEYIDFIRIHKGYLRACLSILNTTKLLFLPKKHNK
ncbi:glycosyltransferase family 2 protein [Maribellus mangrovi]|uniref:glycosyltransferase family 2 protein n=1 Tax=Maribellus mangrovi TaxID=3133146 RepID=UPI0030EE086F